MRKTLKSTWALRRSTQLCVFALQRTHSLPRFPKARFTTRYLDSHVYVLRRSVLGMLREHDGLLSFREEVLPWLCKLGYRKSKRDRWGPCKSITLPFVLLS